MIFSLGELLFFTKYYIVIFGASAVIAGISTLFICALPNILSRKHGNVLLPEHAALRKIGLAVSILVILSGTAVIIMGFSQGFETGPS